jgi:hypothetical protein
MIALLGASQQAITQGGFCAIVASALSVYDFGETVLSCSGRVVFPITFPEAKPLMQKKQSTLSGGRQALSLVRSAARQSSCFGSK